MRTLIQLGIFDDHDLVPTQVVMLWDGQPPWDKPRPQDLAELRKVGEAEYGRPAPDHALFWSASPEPEES